MEADKVTRVSSDSWYSAQSVIAQEPLGKDAFLKLLLAQIKHQDPMAPLGNTEFIAEMAQFSSLEQMNNLARIAEEISLNQKQAALVSETTSLIGRTVTVKYPDPETEGELLAVTGTVSSVRLVEGWPKLVINGQPFDPAYVTEVA